MAENVDKSTICELELDEAKVKQFKDAIESSYWFEFFMGMLCISFTMIKIQYIQCWIHFLLLEGRKILMLLKVEMA